MKGWRDRNEASDQYWKNDQGEYITSWLVEFGSVAMFRSFASAEPGGSTFRNTPLSPNGSVSMLGAVPELSSEEQEIKNREAPRTKVGSQKRDFMDARLSELGDERGKVSRASAAQSDLRKAKSASLSPVLRLAASVRDAAASPACSVMAPSIVLARPSCR